jgi:SPP1 gp7 family putative phage head morphogenesis protein
MKFKEYWKLAQATEEEYLIKSSDKLSMAELLDIQKTISRLQKKGYSANRMIKYIQDHNAKLSERYKAERVYYTEIKGMETQEVIDAGEFLEIPEYRVLLSPNACEHCVKAFKGKTFKQKELQKGGVPIIPLHPNCYCALVPR